MEVPLACSNFDDILTCLSAPYRPTEAAVDVSNQIYLIYLLPISVIDFVLGKLRWLCRRSLEGLGVPNTSPGMQHHQLVPQSHLDTTPQVMKVHANQHSRTTKARPWITIMSPASMEVIRTRSPLAPWSALFLLSSEFFDFSS